MFYNFLKLVLMFTHANGDPSSDHPSSHQRQCHARLGFQDGPAIVAWMEYDGMNSCPVKKSVRLFHQLKMDSNELPYQNPMP